MAYIHHTLYNMYVHQKVPMNNNNTGPPSSLQLPAPSHLHHHVAAHPRPRGRRHSLLELRELEDLHPCPTSRLQRRCSPCHCLRHLLRRSKGQPPRHGEAGGGDVAEDQRRGGELDRRPGAAAVGDQRAAGGQRLAQALHAGAAAAVQRQLGGAQLGHGLAAGHGGGLLLAQHNIGAQRGQRGVRAGGGARRDHRDAPQPVGLGQRHHELAHGALSRVLQHHVPWRQGREVLQQPVGGARRQRLRPRLRGDAVRQLGHGPRVRLARRPPAPEGRGERHDLVADLEAVDRAADRRHLAHAAQAPHGRERRPHVPHPRHHAQVGWADSSCKHLDADLRIAQGTHWLVPRNLEDRSGVSESLKFYRGHRTRN
mmetsp:Transcript_43804/g.75678  ORF Transcript_43804/g.75678 Transcript_43804/m.75678 type:complete len:369 (-) Transcript_43804:153-1259(-)